MTASSPDQRSLVLIPALSLFPRAAANNDGGGFSGPTLEEFFPEGVFFVGTPFEMNRIMLIRVVAMVIILVVLWLGTRRMRVVPGRGQGFIEYVLNIPYQSIAVNQLGEKDGRRFAPLIMTIFVMVIVMNLFAVLPAANIAGTSVIGVPLLLSVVAYIAFVYAGIRAQGWRFFKNSLIPHGVPWYLWVIVIPIEFVSTFVLRPVTLTLRLLMNMVAGHLLLVLLFSATSFFLLEADGALKLFSVGTFIFGIAFSGFEILVAILQAYIFALLTTVYIQLALADEH